MQDNIETQENRRRQLEGLPVIRRGVAGIDLGSKQHWVCAPTEDGAGREITDFGSTTSELLGMAKWLKDRKVESIAMESTGVYWIAPYEVLEAAGLEILLVDTRQLAQVPGRDKKTDPTDCEWIQRLHSCGLLRGSFRPPEQVCMLRTLVRDKANLVAECGDWLRRMQKSLDQMNVRVHRAVSDIDGVTGLAILRAIVNGERDARQLAKLRDKRCRKTEEEIAEVMGITPDKVREIIKVSQDPVSLETPIGEEEDSHLGDFVEDREAVSPSDAASLTMLHSEVEDVLDTLTPRERRVLQLRFGLIDGHQRTLEEVGKRFGVTRERIRQIEAKALRKLRHPSRSKKLRDYLE